MKEPRRFEPYVERVRFTPMVIFVLVFFFGVTGIWGWLFGTDPALRQSPGGWAIILVPIAVFGGAGVTILIDTLRYPLALRVDHVGVTLGRSAVLLTHHGWSWRTPQVTVPWHDAEAVVLYQVSNHSSGTSMGYVGLRLRAGVAQPPGEPSEKGFWRRLGGWLGQDLPPEGVTVYRQIFGWRLDEKRLRKLVKQHTGGAVRVTGGL
jgi:hypothetical protein